MNWLDRLVGKIGRRNDPSVQGGTGQDLEGRKAGDTILRERTTGPSLPSASAAIRAAEAQVLAEWKVGDVILDLYEVKEVHEGGGMGLVYRVYHRGWNTDLAVKSPRPDYFQTETQKDNFTRECETWINLGLHRHIVSCYYVRALGGVPRVFAEYVEGGSLKEWIESRRLYEGGPQEALKHILDIAIQSAWGLDYAHEQGLIHQDVKPANVLMAPDGTAKIGDFGLAKARALAGESVVVGAGRSVLVSSGGMTPVYCSPEQASKQSLSRKTDIWSWAVSVMEMLVGEVCWQNGVAAPQVLKRLDEVRVEGVGIPAPPSALTRLLERCFSLEPEVRPESFTAIANELIGIYGAVTGEEFARELTRGAGMRADGLNNRALSLLDIGRSDESVAVFDQALAVEPGHPESVYNRGLWMWRHGKLSDTGLVDSIRASTAGTDRSQRGDYLAGLVHLERGDAAKALECLQAACAEGEPSLELLAAREQAQALVTKPPQVRSFEGHTKTVKALVVGEDGHSILSGGEDATIRLWDASAGRCLRVFEGQTLEVEAIAISTNGRWMVSGGKNGHGKRDNWDNTIRVWDASSGRLVRVFDGHREEVNALAISGDGTKVLAGSWNEETSQAGALANLAKRSRPDEQAAVALMVADHERKAKSGYYSKALRLWDINSGRCVRDFEQPPGSVNCVALSPDGRWAFGGIEKYKRYGDGSVRQWDVSSGRCVRVMEGHAEGANCMTLSRDGRSLLSGGGDAMLRVWDVASGRCVRVLEGHRHRVNSVAISPDDRLAVSSGADSTVKLWEVASGRCLRTFDQEASVVAFSNDARWVIAAAGKSMRMWELPEERKSTWVVIRPVSSREHIQQTARYNAALRVGQSHAKDYAWESAANAAREAMRCTGFSRAREAVSLLNQANLHGRRGGLQEASCRIIPAEIEMTCVALSDDVSRALSSTTLGISKAGDQPSVLHLWDLTSGRTTRTFDGHKNYVKSVSLSKDGRLAASASGSMVDFTDHSERAKGQSGIISMSTGIFVRDYTVRIWDIETGQCLRIMEGHNSMVESVTFSADARWVLSGAWGQVKLWDVATGACLRTFEGHRKHVCAVSLSTDGRFAISGSDDNTLRLWDVATGQCLRTMAGQKFVPPPARKDIPALPVFDTEPIGTDFKSVCLSADSRFILTGGQHHTLSLWDVATGACVRTFAGHTKDVRAVGLSADGTFAVSASDDNTLRLWDCSTGSCVRTLEGHKATVHSAAISADGRFILSGSRDRTLRLWELDWHHEFPQSKDWDEGARPYLNIFLNSHCPLGDDGVTRKGRPDWTGADFEKLLTDLQCRGYGWLRPDGVRRQLEKVTAEWEGPTPLP